MSKNHLYLFEFLVDDLKVTNPKRCTCTQEEHSICVEFSFGDNVLVTIPNIDTSSPSGQNADKTICCLFSEKESELSGENMLYLRVYKKGCITCKYLIGRAAICVNSLFEKIIQPEGMENENFEKVIGVDQLMRDLMKIVIPSTDTVNTDDRGVPALPQSNTLNESVNIFNRMARPIGTIRLTVNLTCLGKLEENEDANNSLKNQIVDKKILSNIIVGLDKIIQTSSIGVVTAETNTIDISKSDKKTSTSNISPAIDKFVQTSMIHVSKDNQLSEEDDKMKKIFEDNSIKKRNAEDTSSGVDKIVQTSCSQLSKGIQAPCEDNSIKKLNAEDTSSRLDKTVQTSCSQLSKNIPIPCEDDSSNIVHAENINPDYRFIFLTTPPAPSESNEESDTGSKQSLIKCILHKCLKLEHCIKDILKDQHNKREFNNQNFDSNKVCETEYNQEYDYNASQEPFVPDFPDCGHMNHDGFNTDLENSENFTIEEPCHTKIKDFEHFISEKSEMPLNYECVSIGESMPRPSCDCDFINVEEPCIGNYLKRKTGGHILNNKKLPIIRENMKYPGKYQDDKLCKKNEKCQDKVVKRNKNDISIQFKNGLQICPTLCDDPLFVLKLRDRLSQKENRNTVNILLQKPGLNSKKEVNKTTRETQVDEDLLVPAPQITQEKITDKAKPIGKGKKKIPAKRAKI